MPLGQRCCIIGCRATSHKRDGTKIENGLRFYSIPKVKLHARDQMRDVTTRRRRAWISAIRRPCVTFERVTYALRVCSKHFHKGAPAYEMMETDPDWAPSLNLGHSEVTVTNTKRPARCPRQTQVALPAEECGDPNEDESTTHAPKTQDSQRQTVLCACDIDEIESEFLKLRRKEKKQKMTIESFKSHVKKHPHMTVRVRDTVTNMETVIIEKPEHSSSSESDNDDDMDIPSTSTDIPEDLHPHMRVRVRDTVTKMESLIDLNPPAPVSSCKLEPPDEECVFVKTEPPSSESENDDMDIPSTSTDIPEDFVKNKTLSEETCCPSSSSDATFNVKFKLEEIDQLENLSDECDSQCTTECDSQCTTEECDPQFNLCDAQCNHDVGFGPGDEICYTPSSVLIQNQIHVYTSAEIKVIEKGVKNKFRLSWLEDKDVNGDFFSEYLRKIPVPGTAFCLVCDSRLVYGKKGKSVLHRHAASASHFKKRNGVKKNQFGRDEAIRVSRCPQKGETVPSCAPQNVQQESQTLPAQASPHAESPDVDIKDRILHQEAILCDFISEHSLPLSIAPHLIGLAQTLSEDATALQSHIVYGDSDRYSNRKKSKVKAWRNT